MFFIFQEIVKKYGKRVILPFSIIVILLIYFLYPQEKSTTEDLQIQSFVPDSNVQEKESDQLENPPIEKVIIDIKGAVKHPGVYELTAENRIIDAINQAGGYTDEADSSTINHAQKLQDEMILYIPKKGENVSEELVVAQSATIQSTSSQSSAFKASSTSSSNGGDKVNINKANEAELMTLSGIGPAKAQAILAYREENGPFKTIEDLKNVSGIGEKTFEKLKDSITVK